MNRRNILGVLTSNLGFLMFSKSIPKIEDDYTQSKVNQRIGNVHSDSGTNKNQSMNNYNQEYNTVLNCARSSQEQVEWDKIVDRINKEIKVSIDDTISTKLDINVCKIDFDWKFNSEINDNLLLPNQIESLINEASDLLERGLSIRAQYDQIGSKYFELLIELKEYIELDRIHQEEIRQGVYEVNYLQNFHSLESENKRLEATKEKSLLSTHISNWFSKKKEEYSFFKQLRAWAGALGNVRVKGTNYEYYQDSFGRSGSSEMHNHIRSAEKEIADLDNQFSSITYASFEKSHKLEFASDEEKAKAQKIITDWQFANRNFSVQRMCIARQFQDIKAKVATDSNGILNHGKRLSSLQSRFGQDFRNAYARLLAVEKGLEQVYNYSAINKLPLNPNSIDFFDYCLIWSRDVTEYLIKKRQNDQGLNWPISLKKSLGEAIFKEGLREGIWQIDIASSSFMSMSLLRMRGLTCYICSNEVSKNENVWQIKISPPKIAKYIYSATSESSHSQEYINDLILGRVNCRDSLHEPEINGTSSLYNSSPIGNWKIQVIGNLLNTDINNLSDIQLDIFLLYQNI